MAKRDPVMSSNSNDTIGKCANPLLDDTRWLVSRYTCCNVPAVSASPVAARDIRRVGQPPSVGHDRVSPGREPRAQTALGWAAHSLYRYRAPPTRQKSAHSWTQGPERTSYLDHAGYPTAVVPRTGRM